MIEKTTLNVQSPGLDGPDLPDGTKAARASASGGALSGINETWGKNPWRQTNSEPEGFPDALGIGSGQAEEKEPSEAPFSADDLNQGYKVVSPERTATFDPDITGEEPVGDPFKYGGFLGRPRGTAR